MEIQVIKRIIFEKKYWVLRHFLFWMLFIILFPLLDLSIHTNLKESYETCLIMMPSNIIYTYVIIYWLIPKYLIKEKYGAFCLLFSLWVIIGLHICLASRYFLLIPFRQKRPISGVNPNPSYLEIFLTFPFVIGNSIALFAVFIKLFKFWYTKQKQALQLASEKLFAELQLLKAQIHPHFLFNTLNNLYSMVLRKSDKAPEALLKLSGLMGYMLYDCNVGYVPLEKEVSVMKDYIALEQERYGERLEVSLNFSGDIPDKEIAPLLMLPLIENAFKHGPSQQIDKAWISFDLTLRDHVMKLSLINSKNIDQIVKNRAGLGINNVKKRLELLYPGKYEMKMGDEGELFYVALTLIVDTVQKLPLIVPSKSNTNIVK